MSDFAEVVRTAPASVRNRGGVWTGIACLLIVAYFVGVGFYALRAPFGDDHAMISGAAAFHAAATPVEAWTALSAQHNEHRPVVVRLVFWAAEMLPGPLNVTLIAIAGNLFLLLMFALVLREARRVSPAETYPVAFVAVGAALLFNFGFAESALWPMAAVSNFGVLAMTLAMLVLLSLRGAMALLAIAPTLLAVGLQGNGVFAPFIGALFLLANRRYATGALWLAVGVAAAAWFAAGYQRPEPSPDLAGLVARAGEIVVYALAFCGSAAGFGGKSLGSLNTVFVSIAASVGAILIALSAYAALRGGLGGRRIALWLNVFIIITAFATAASRIDYGVQQALVPRYHINSCLLVASTLVALLGLGEADPVGRIIRRGMGVFAAIGVIYFLATTPILLMMHRMYQSPPPNPPAAAMAPAIPVSRRA